MTEWDRIQTKIKDGGFGITNLEFRARAARAIQAGFPDDGNIYGITSSDVNHVMYAEARVIEQRGGEPFADFATERVLQNVVGN